MGKPISVEITAIPDTISWALNQDVKLFKRTVLGASDKGLIAIGSGGSFSAAAYIAQLHEFAFRRVSRPSTPLEYVTHQYDLPRCATALVSAEGKNKDILAAAKTMSMAHSGGFAFSLTTTNPLADFCHETGAATNICFDAPWGKDGYLATNSLIATMALAARAYTDSNVDEALRSIDASWLEARRQEISKMDIWKELTPNRQLLVLFGSVGKIVAIDFESKFAEGTLGPCQIVDYRQFAHGRHLQLQQPLSPFVIAIFSEADQPLIEQTLALMPQSVPISRLELRSDPISAEIFGVIEALLIVETIGAQRGIDVGQPIVPQFGKSIYALDMRAAYPEPDDKLPLAIARKFTPSTFTSQDLEIWKKAGAAFCDRLAKARFRALVCDFDGTCCDTDKRFDGTDARLIGEFERFADAGCTVGFATGRGDSLHKDLREKLAERLWPDIITGYYSGSVIEPLTAPAQEPPVDSRLSSLSDWLGQHGLLEQVGSVPKLNGGQLSLRVQNQAAKGKAIAAIQHWIREQGHDGWRVFCSGHSIDVLTNKIGKRLVVDEIARRTGACAETEILRIGDSGDFDGNDFELLNAGLGLSVANVSPIAEACWNLLPRYRHGSAGTHYYLSSLETEGHLLRFTDRFIEDVYQLCTFKGYPN